MFFHSQITHQPYGWLADDSLKNENNKLGLNYENVDLANKIVTGSDKTDYMANATWYSIQKLKRIFKYLKNLPCNDPNRPWVKNQYDNMNIYVISDHGKQIHYDSSIKGIFDILCNKNKVLTNSQRDYLVNGIINSDESLGYFNSIFIRKPALYSKESGMNKSFTEETNSKINQFFNFSQLVTNADFYPIIEADLYAQNYNSKNTKSKTINWDEFDSVYKMKFSKETLFKNISNETLKNILIKDFYNNVIVNPLNNPKSNERSIPLFTLSWWFEKDSYKYKFKTKKRYTPNSINGVPSVYNVSNYADAESELKLLK